MSDIIDNNFEFPKNLKELSEEEKEKLHHDYMVHSSNYSNSVEATPSKVLLPESIEYKARKTIQKNPSKYLFPTNAPLEPKPISQSDGLGKGRPTNISEPTLKNLMREIAVKEYQERMANMDPILRKIEERFGNI